MSYRFQEHRIAVPVMPNRIARQVNVHRPGERVRHHQGRGGQIIGLHERVDAALKVTIARKH